MGNTVHGTSPAGIRVLGSISKRAGDGRSDSLNMQVRLNPGRGGHGQDGISLVILYDTPQTIGPGQPRERRERSPS